VRDQTRFFRRLRGGDEFLTRKPVVPLRYTTGYQLSAPPARKKMSQRRLTPAHEISSRVDSGIFAPSASGSEANAEIGGPGGSHVDPRLSANGAKSGRDLRGGGDVCGDALEGVDHLGAEAAEGIAVGGGETMDELLACRGEGEENLAAIVGSYLTDHGAAGHELVDDADGAVVAYLELFGEVAYGKFTSGGGRMDGEKRLVLIWGEILRGEQIFAEAEELSQLIAKGGEGFVVHLVHG
jgi:hypothetical protein